MRANHLATYLNDHLAGSVALIELLDHLLQTEAGKHRKDFLLELQSEVKADQLTLESIIRRTQAGTPQHRKAVAWLAEKFVRLKLRLDDSANGAWHWLEAIELVAIGIHGKQALWQALDAAAEQEPVLQGIDYEPRLQRAEAQHSRVEALRLEAAKTALACAAMPV